MASDTGQGGSSANNSSDFVRKLYKMLENPNDEHVVRWGDNGDSFVVLENEKFTKQILPKHFKHSNFASFVRQLNKYDFHKVKQSNEESAQQPYGSGAWEFKHPDFKMNNKDALDNIRRKAPAPRKPNQISEDMIPTQQMDLINSQLMATQQQLQQLQDRYNELSIHHSMLLQELIGVQKTVVNHEHVMQNVMSYLHASDARQRRDSTRFTFHQPDTVSNGVQHHPPDPAAPPMDEDVPASPLQHASRLLSETNADLMLNPRNLEQMNEISIRMNGTMTTPPPAVSNGVRRPTSREPPTSVTSNSSQHRYGELDNVVYPVGQTTGIDPMYSEHINNIPYPLPGKNTDQTESRYHTERQPQKKSAQVDPGWIRQPQILLVEDDPTCRRIGGKFLYAFHCAIDSAFDGLEAVDKMNNGSKYDLVLMDIIMPNLDGVSACHLIRQFDSTPIIAMTSNIRSDDISMYFQHGMNDVLPKPFTKEGLLNMLEKHLAHLKKQSLPGSGQVVGPNFPSANLTPGPKRSVKDEESAEKSSPNTASTWESPNPVHGVSPVGSNVGPGAVNDEYMNHSTFGMQPGIAAPGPVPYNASATANMGVGPRGQQSGPPQAAVQHRRGINEISGGDDMNRDSKRQQIYGPGPPLPPQSLVQMPRPG